MTSSSSYRETLERVLQEADMQMQGIDHSPFSSPAFSTLKEKTGEYIIQLISESISVSRRYRADIVSEIHVKRASILCPAEVANFPDILEQ